MKINFKSRPECDSSINVPGMWVFSNKDGKTRKKGGLYKVIENPKTKKIEDGFMWFISEGGFPCKISYKNINSFRKATEKEVREFLDNK